MLGLLTWESLYFDFCATLARDVTNSPLKLDEASEWVVSSVTQIHFLIKKFKVIPDPKPTPVAPKTLTPSRLNYVG